jgi:hypothetical protein
MSKLISHEAFGRVKGLLDNTKGTIVIGGETDKAANFIAPTVVKDVEGEDSLMSEYVSFCLTYKNLSRPGMQRNLWTGVTCRPRRGCG